MNSPVDVLQSYWGYRNFRPYQEEIIQAILDKEDCFVLLPTGGGKSLCFQIPALLLDGICIVISPLVALMQDQVQELQNKNIKAMAIPSGIAYQELDTLLDNCIYGNYKFLYLSPERLQQEIVQERIKQMNVSLIAVDEAHCISQWGHDFRPSYRKISILRTLHPSAPLVSLTASATREVVTDCMEELELFQPQVFKQSFERNNLIYNVASILDKRYFMMEMLKKYPGSSIIYVRNRKSSIEISSFLKSAGYSSTYYHGGMEASEKKKKLEDWKRNDIQIMVATNAFGMGIDKADVRTVFHYNIPESIESYFQEAGRAGRDGHIAHAFLMFHENDILQVHNQFIKVLPDTPFIKTLYRKLCNYFQISYGEGTLTTHDFNFNEFCKTYDFNSMIAYNALLFLDRCSIVRFSQQFTKNTTLHITASGEEIVDHLRKQPDARHILKAILRTYSGIFDEETSINLSIITKKIQVSEKKVIELLKKLETEGFLECKHQRTDAAITFLVPREDDRTIYAVEPYIKKQRASKIEKINAILNFIQNDSVCRSKQLLLYFGEKKVEVCGQCDVCQKTKTPSFSKQEVRDEILRLLATVSLSSREILSESSLPEAILIKELRQLITEDKIQLQSDNKYYIRTKK